MTPTTQPPPTFGLLRLRFGPFSGTMGRCFPTRSHPTRPSSKTARFFLPLFRTHPVHAVGMCLGKLQRPCRSRFCVRVNCTHGAPKLAPGTHPVCCPLAPRWSCWVVLWGHLPVWCPSTAPVSRCAFATVMARYCRFSVPHARMGVGTWGLGYLSLCA